MMHDNLDDATRSRLANLVRKAGGGTITLYAIRHKENDLVILVIATCAEEGLKLIRGLGLADWTLANTVCNRIQKRIDAEPGIISAFRIVHPR
jgi:hypothetical protein